MAPGGTVHLVQVLLPLYDNDGEPLPRDLHRQVGAELAERFGGLTAHTRAPAEGLWRDGPAETVRDDIVIYEVMTEALDRKWWQAYRRRLETRFRQDQVVIRVQDIDLV
jgi:hypothetical protein